MQSDYPKVMLSDNEKAKSIIRHIKRVEDNCNIIAMTLMETNPAFATNIMKRGRVHDTSKFEEFEFNHLWRESQFFKQAVLHHHQNNTHHPEHFRNGVYGMSDLDICEMVCDTTARAQEFGTDVRLWLLGKAADIYGYSSNHEGDKSIRKKIEYYLNILLKEPFK